MRNLKGYRTGAISALRISQKTGRVRRYKSGVRNDAIAYENSVAHACNEDPVVIRKILNHLQEKSALDSGVRIANPRAPPQASLFGQFGGIFLLYPCCDQKRLRQGGGWSENSHWREHRRLRAEFRGSAPDAGKISGVLGMQNVLNGVSIAVSVMENAHYSSYTPTNR